MYRKSTKDHVVYLGALHLAAQVNVANEVVCQCGGKEKQTRGNMKVHRGKEKGNVMQVHMERKCYATLRGG